MLRIQTMTKAPAFHLMGFLYCRISSQRMKRKCWWVELTAAHGLLHRAGDVNKWVFKLILNVNEASFFDELRWKRQLCFIKPVCAKWIQINQKYLFYSQFLELWTENELQKDEIIVRFIQGLPRVHAICARAFQTSSTFGGFPNHRAMFAGIRSE